MSLKKDAERRYVEIELELPGTPEQIWQAMATGAGYSAWFTPTEIEEREGGEIRFHLGPDMTSSGRVTEWRPPFRFAYEEIGWSGEAPPLATEVVIEAASGGLCKVRMVHSLFTSRDDWDDEIAGMMDGWPAYLGILRLYLQSFAGQEGASARPTVRFAGSHDEAWTALRKALSLEGAKVGDRREIALADGPRLAGAVERVAEAPRNREFTLRLDAPRPGVALIGTYDWGGQVNVAAMLFFYGEGAQAAAEAEGARWQAWLNARFAAEAAEAKPG
ncbi:MAG: SRPBCC family protein [Phenylobacterium sp.]|uniref:SRPBCC family protein n=1 Tax=Phenylobacterium sp. TaxID=1871053 RepID=UPI00391C3208